MLPTVKKTKELRYRLLWYTAFDDTNSIRARIWFTGKLELSILAALIVIYVRACDVVFCL